MAGQDDGEINIEKGIMRDVFGFAFPAQLSPFPEPSPS
jgi:hypothetical protein